MSFLLSIVELARLYLKTSICVTVFALYLLHSKMQNAKRNPNRLPFPPGPRPLPVIGNLLDIPSEKPWLMYDKWMKQYGDIIHLRILNQHIFILGTAKRTFDLFEKRSSLYSDRIRLVMMNEMIGWDRNFAMIRYGDWWRQHRRMFHEYFHPNAVVKYQPIQSQESRKLLGRLLETPDLFADHIRQAFAATIMDVAYGIQVKELDDPYIVTAEKAMTSLAIAGNPGTFWVDYLPFLKHLPAWLPGMGFKTQAAIWRKSVEALMEDPLQATKSAMARGVARPSVAATLLDRYPPGQNKVNDTLVKQTVGIAYAAGADTTISAAQSFFLAMAKYPDVQRKAQAELDAVIGHGRIPDFADRSFLPYINAVVKETMRWMPVTPLAVAHSLTTDDEYDGYFIPAGSIVVGSSWSILHDPEMYPEPEEFRPDRFIKDGQLNPEIRDPHTASFGFGRRICPGRYLSDNSLYSVVASTLAVYDISPPVDNNGNTIELVPDMTTGLLSYPKSFKCIVKPRSKAAEALIRECLDAADTI